MTTTYDAWLLAPYDQPDQPPCVFAFLDDDTLVRQVDGAEPFVVRHRGGTASLTEVQLAAFEAAEQQQCDGCAHCVRDEREADGE